MDASEYKQVFWGLIFLKYISERFDRRREQLKAENQGFEDSKDEYSSCGVYFIPEDARWREIMRHCDTRDIGSCIDHAIAAIEQENPELKGLLPRYYARAELDQNRLSRLVRRFDECIDTETGSNTLGAVYEYCLTKFAEQEGRQAGEFYSPRSEVRVLVQAIDARHGRLYDPCCGSGGMFIYAAQEIARQGGQRGIFPTTARRATPQPGKCA